MSCHYGIKIQLECLHGDSLLTPWLQKLQCCVSLTLRLWHLLELFVVVNYICSLYIWKVILNLLVNSTDLANAFLNELTWNWRGKCLFSIYVIVQIKVVIITESFEDNMHPSSILLLHGLFSFYFSLLLSMENIQTQHWSPLSEIQKNYPRNLPWIPLRVPQGIMPLKDLGFDRIFLIYIF